MQGDRLREPMLAGCSGWSSGRFSPLLLQHNEYYFCRQDAVCLQPSSLSGDAEPASHVGEAGATPTASDQVAPTRSPKHVRRCTGVLHVCSKSLFFEPSDAELAVVRLPLADVHRFTPWEPDDAERADLQECGVEVGNDAKKSAAHRSPAHIHDAPASVSPISSKSTGSWFSGWKTKLLGTAQSHRHSSARQAAQSSVRWKLFQIDAERVLTALKGNKCDRPKSVELDQPLHFAVKHVDVPGRSDASDARAQPLECSVLITLLMSEATVKSQACGLSDAPWSPFSPLLRQLIKEHEISCLSLPPPCEATRGHQRILCRGRAVRVSPLAETPGRLILTDKNIFFRPFCVGEEGEEQVAMMHVLRVARRRYNLQNTAVELFLKGSAGT